MNRYRSILCFILLAYAAPAMAQDNKTFIEYKVVRGDTCTGIAKKVYGSGKLCYKMISKFNKMNKKFVIVPGQILKLPTREELQVAPKVSKPDAVLTQRKGSVETRAPKAKWSTAPKGKELYKLWRVNSGDKSSAEVSFTKASGRLQMRSNTLVIIYGPTKEKSKRVASKAVLERGTLKSRLAELSGKSSQVVVETPASTTTLGAGDALVAVEKSGTTRVANFTSADVSIQGKDAPTKKRKKRRKKKRRIVKLPKNMGSKIVPGKDPSPPKPLPVPPTWRAKSPLHVMAINGLSKQKVSWNPVAKAKSYRVEILGDAKGGQLLDQFKVDAQYTSIVLQDLPPQTYYTRVSTIDDDAFEGKPSAPIQLIIHNGNVQSAKNMATKKDDKTLFVGSSLAISGLKCKTPDMKTHTPKLVFSKTGAQEVSCVTDTGVALPPATLNVTAVEMSGIPTQSLALDTTKTVTFSTTPPVESIDVQAPEHVNVTKKKLDNGQWQLTVEQKPDAPKSEGALKVLLGNQSQPVTLASIPVNTVEAKAQPATPKPVAKDYTFNLGLYGTGLGFYDGLTFDDQALSSGFRIGISSDYLLSKRFSVGAQLELGDSSFESQNREINGYGLAAYGVFHILTGRIRPFVKVAAGVDFARYYSDFDESTGTYDPESRQVDVLVPFQAGLGVKVRFGDFDLMLSVQEYILPFNADGLALYTGGSLGFAAHF